MIYIITALHCEAKPLIGKFVLKKAVVPSRLDVFRNERIVLVVSGIGKVRSAIATTFLLSQNSPPPGSIVANIGCCGSVGIHNEIGSLLFINKITDHGSGRDMYPDSIVKHGLNEAPIETYDIPVKRDLITAPGAQLVDMESSGFFQAASRFVDTHQIYCLKVVSDFLELSHLSKEFISGLIEKKLSDIERVLELFSKFNEPDKELFHVEETELLERISDHLKLTETQYHQFITLAKSAKIRDRNLLESLAPFAGSEIKTKNESKNTFERIRKALG